MNERDSFLVESEDGPEVAIHALKKCYKHEPESWEVYPTNEQPSHLVVGGVLQEVE